MFGLGKLVSETFRAVDAVVSPVVQVVTVPITAVTEVATAEARIAELEKDAARYRWLRENCVEQAAEDDVGPCLYHGVPWNCNWRRELDDAVDDAMSREA